MTTPPPLPTLPGLAWSRHKRPGFTTRVASHVSGREVRVALMAYPLYEFEAVYGGLTSSASLFSGLGASSLQTLMGFFLELQGQFASFLYTDPDDSAAADQGIATGDGTSTCFTLVRSLGGFVEPVGWATSVSNVYLDGAATSGFTLYPPNQIVLAAPPGPGVVVTASFSYAFQCRFLDDQMDFEEFMSALWKLDSMKFRSIKAQNAAPSYLPPPLGETPPTVYADFINALYWADAAPCASLSAWLTAIGGTFTRASSASFTNSTGQLAQAANNTARFDYDPVALTPKGLLLEGASGNALLQSNGFGNSPWDNQGGTCSQNAAGPDGGASSAWTTTAAGGLNWFNQPFSPAVALPLSLSVWAKAGTDDWAYFLLNDGANIIGCWFNASTGAAGTNNVVISGSAAFTLSNPTIIQYPNGWYRMSVTAAGAPTIASAYMGFSDGNGATGATNGNTGLVFGAQLEALPFASSYIPTTSAAASRAADSFSLGSTAATVLSGSAFTAMVETAGLQVEGGGIILTGNASDNDQTLATNNASKVYSYQANAGAALEATIGGSGSTAGKVNAVVAQDSTGRLIVANQGSAASDSNLLLPVTAIQLGSFVGGGAPAFGDFMRLGFWPVKASAVQAAELSAP